MSNGAGRQRQHRRMEALRLINVNLEQAQNHDQHKTRRLNSSSLVVRRGQTFNLTLSFNGAYRPNRDRLELRIELDRVPFDVPVSFSKDSLLSALRWSANIQQGMVESSYATTAVLCVNSPANASIGVYQMQLLVMSSSRQNSYNVGQFTLLCNPWCQNDSVYLALENEREEYVRNDFGLVYQGTPRNIVGRPWNLDLYERDVLESCIMLLQMSPEHQSNPWMDNMNRANPVYISRVVSAMINSNDDLGVVQGNWSEDYSGGIHPTQWRGSGDILRRWAQSGCRPVKYGQCWVFAAVMCTVMRVLGIPTRVVTNFNSAHDSNGNLVVDEYYNEMGEKLSYTKDSIWNFHVWVECWMKRPDLKMGFDGWQVLDPTPQEKSAGSFRCGPAPVKAVQERRIDLNYDIPFVYAEVNADVRVCIVYQGNVVDSYIETDRVGSLVCTKSLGSNQRQDITSTYKQTTARQPTYSSPRTMAASAEVDTERSAQGLSVTLNLLKVPVVGENISFSVTVTNKGSIPRNLKEHVNAQAKSYNRNPSKPFWEAHNSNIKLGPNESKVLNHQISYRQYAALEDDQLVNLAVVIEDEKSQERVLASEEFNFAKPAINIQIVNENSIMAQVQQTAMVTFTNSFSMPVNGILTLTGVGLLEDKAVSNIVQLQPGKSVDFKVNFTPTMAGVKTLYANVKLNNIPTFISGFKTIAVRPAIR